MTLETHLQQDARDPLTPQFGNALDHPVDYRSDWPDLRYRDLTADELAAMRLKIAQMVETVEAFDKQLEREEAARRADPDWRERPDRLPYVPGSIISLIHMPLKLAQRMLDERRGDEEAVAHLRLAETLVRLLVTWRGAAVERLIEHIFGLSGEGLGEELFGVQSEGPIATPADKDAYTPPRFFILEPVEHSA